MNIRRNMKTVFFITMYFCAAEVDSLLDILKTNVTASNISNLLQSYFVEMLMWFTILHTVRYHADTPITIKAEAKP